jgi:thiol-disulfide isomerase/thioredoxin
MNPVVASQAAPDGRCDRRRIDIDRRAGCCALALAAGLGILTTWTGAASAAEFSPPDEAAKPSFSLESLANGRIDLSEHKGRVVLVHFFATWCEPCRPELSALQRLADRFARRPLMVIAVDVGEVDVRVRRFFDELPVTFPVLLDRDKAVTKAWKVAMLPTTFVLDRTLAPRFMVEGDFDWDRPEADRQLDALASDIRE